MLLTLLHVHMRLSFKYILLSDFISAAAVQRQDR